MRTRRNGIGPKRLLGAALVSFLAWVAPVADAQILVDGNIFFNNGASGTLGGQFTGASTAVGAPACPTAPQYSASILGSVTYVDNTYTDPLLGAALYQVGVIPNFRPGLGSPAYPGNAPHGKAVNVPADGFFTQTCFVGALDVSPAKDWTLGWTYYDSTGAGRQDLHYDGICGGVPAMPDPRPCLILDNHIYYANRTLSADTNYVVRGQLRVKEQATLTIAAGTVIFEERSTVGTIVVERGGKIVANGTQDEPIIITSDQPPGSMTTGSIGGLVIHGRATTNAVNSCAGDSAASEGGLVGHYGGGDDNDDSGSLRYVRIEYAGREISPNNELNSFTFNAVGRNTTLEYLQAHRGLDDLFEFFGGSAQAKYLLGTDGNDDGFDWQMGYHGKAQFVIIRLLANTPPANLPDKGIEADNKELDENNVTCSGRANATLANVTFVGDRRTGPAFTGVTAGINLRRGTAGTILNSIIYNFKTAGVRIDDQSTWQAHCLAIPASPGVFCNGETASIPLQQGRLFVGGYPNPFRSKVAVRFALPAEGHVTVDIFDADGRLVRRLADRGFTAGQHTVSWEVGRTVPSGVYFYQVRAAGAESSGKLVRVD